MANPSILAAFERMWQHTIAKIGTKADADHGHAVIVETNKNLEQKFWRGTQTEYDAIEVKDDATMYIVTDGEGGEGGSPIIGLPTVTEADNGKFLRVVGGVWVADEVPNAEGVGF